MCYKHMMVLGLQIPSIERILEAFNNFWLEFAYDHITSVYIRKTLNFYLKSEVVLLPTRLEMDLRIDSKSTLLALSFIHYV